jgi:hypothetical protein
MREYDWLCCGYKDALEGAPAKRAPDVPTEELYMIETQALPEVRAYWRGWRSGILDRVSRTLGR